MTVSGDEIVEALTTLVDGEAKTALHVLKEADDHVAASMCVGGFQRFDMLPMPKVECQLGCAWCCRGVKVEVSPPEAITIAGALSWRLDEGAVREFALDLRSAAKHARTLTIADRADARTRCFFLDEETNTCSIYEVRPMRCRGHASADAAACESASKQPNAGLLVPVPALIQQAAAAVSLGQHEALASSGLDNASYELTNAVLVALSSPDAEQEWLNGGTVFHAARGPKADEDARESARALESLTVSNATPKPKQRSPKSDDERRRERNRRKARGRKKPR